MYEEVATVVGAGNWNLGWSEYRPTPGGLEYWPE